jgi:hypothetical protein
MGFFHADPWPHAVMPVPRMGWPWAIGDEPIEAYSGTPEQWLAGEARYNNGVDFELPGLEDVDFGMLIDPNWRPPPPPTDGSAASSRLARVELSAR